MDVLSGLLVYSRGDFLDNPLDAWQVKLQTTAFGGNQFTCSSSPQPQLGGELYNSVLFIQVSSGHDPKTKTAYLFRNHAKTVRWFLEIIKERSKKHQEILSSKECEPSEVLFLWISFLLAYNIDSRLWTWQLVVAWPRRCSPALEQGDDCCQLVRLCGRKQIHLLWGRDFRYIELK